MNHPRQSKAVFWAVQAACLLGFGLSWARGAAITRHDAAPAGLAAEIPRDTPLRVTPLYNDPELISDDDLAAVLSQVRPLFKMKDLKPNFVEHALRIWGENAVFQDPAVLSGAQLRDFLTDHGQYIASWGAAATPLLQDATGGVAVRVAGEQGASVHHDHWLACLTEAGVARHEPIFTPSGRAHTIDDALQQALRDFRVDEREVEWSALAFGLWLPPRAGWYTGDGRHVTFDLIAERLLRGTTKWGVCHGTHRLYSMMALARLDDEFDILSDEVHAAILAHLKSVRQLLIDSQFPDGHWPSNWQDGALAVAKPVEDALYKKVISTGHHLEWLAIAPEELHPPRENLRKAARWAIETTRAQTPAAIREFYTFFSHVGGALALWRSVRPADFYSEWETHHPQPATK